MFNAKVNLVLSIFMFVAGIVLAVGNWPLNIVGKDEPRLIYQMSAMALWFSAYGNILVSVVRKENNNNDDGK
jgi:hypothetical protein